MTAAQGHRFSGAFKTNPRLYQSTAYDINKQHDERRLDNGPPK